MSDDRRTIGLSEYTDLREFTPEQKAAMIGHGWRALATITGGVGTIESLSDTRLGAAQAAIFEAVRQSSPIASLEVSLVVSRIKTPHKVVQA